MSKNKKILLTGIIIFCIGLFLSFISNTISSSYGGDGDLATKIDTQYYVFSPSGKQIKITKNEYLLQNIVGISSFIGILLGWGLIFIFFVKITLKGVGHQFYDLLRKK